MFWEKKEKDRGLPDLPRPPARPTLPPRDFSLMQGDDEDSEEIHGLPSFPDSPMQKGFSQSAIKEAVSHEEIKDEPLYKPTNSSQPGYKFVEMGEWKPQDRMPRETMHPAARRDAKPIFVRLDKFQLARNSLETVKVKLNEIEDLLKTIRDVKSKEDAELSSWESEMENIKARVQTVLNEIFEHTEN